MNATKEMLSAPVYDKTAGLLEALLEGKLANPTALKGLAEGLVASKLPMKNLAISGGLGALAGETSRRLIPTISKKNPKTAKILASLVGGVFGGIPGLATSAISSSLPSIRNAKLLDAYKKIGLATTTGLGAELTMAPIIQQHGNKLLSPELIKSLGSYTSTPGTIAGLAGGSLLTRAGLKNTRLGKHLVGKKGGGVLLDTGLGLMASGHPIIGAATALTAPLKNKKARRFLADVSNQLKRNKEIQNLYKKSSFETTSIKLAAPVYLTRPEYILDAPSLEKVGFGGLVEMAGKGLGSMVNKFTGGRDLIAKGQQQLSKTIQQQGFKPTEFLNKAPKPISGRSGAPIKAPTLGERFRAGFSGVNPAEVSNISTYKNIGQGKLNPTQTFGNMQDKLKPQVLQKRTQAAQQASQTRATARGAEATQAQTSAAAKQQPIDAARSYVDPQSAQQLKLQKIEDRLSNPQAIRSSTKPSGKQSPQGVIDRTGYDFGGMVTTGFPSATSAEGRAYHSVFGKSRTPQESLANINNLYAREAAGTLTQAEKRTLDYVKQHGNMPAREYSTYQNVGGNLTATGNIPITNLNTSNLTQVHIDRLQSVKGVAPSKQLSSGNTRVTTLDDAVEHLEGLPNISNELKDTRQALNQFKTQNKVTRVSKFDRSAIDAQIDATRSRLQAPITENLTKQKQQIQGTIDQTKARLNKDLAEQQAFIGAEQQARKAQIDATQQAAQRGEELTMLAPRTFETVGSKVTGVSRNTGELTSAVAKAEQELKQIDDWIATSGGTPTKQLQEARAKAVSNLQSQRAEQISGAGSNTSRLTAPLDSKLTAPLTAQRTQAIETRISDIQAQATSNVNRAKTLRAKAKKPGVTPTEKTTLRQRAAALENSAKELEAQVPEFQAQLQAQGRGIELQSLRGNIKSQNRQRLTNLKKDQLEQITTGQRAVAIDSDIAAAETALTNAKGTFNEAQARANLKALKSEKQFITRAEKALVERQTGGAFAPASSVKTTAEANKGVTDLEAQINTLTSNTSRTPLQDKRLQELKTLRQEYAEQSVKVNTDKAQLNTFLEGSNNAIKTEEAKLTDPMITAADEAIAKGKIKDLTKERAVAENRLNELARIDQQKIESGYASAREGYLTAPTSSLQTPRQLRSSKLAPSTAEKVTTESQFLGGRGVSKVESNFIANNELLPAGYSEAVTGIFGQTKGSGILDRSAARQAMKDSGLGTELGKVDKAVFEALPRAKTFTERMTPENQAASKLVKDFLTNTKATEQTILEQANKMGPEVETAVTSALKNSNIIKQKEAISKAGSNFSTRLQGKVEIGLAERSDKLTASILKTIQNPKKVSTISESSLQDISSAVSIINKAGLNNTPQGTALLNLVDDVVRAPSNQRVDGLTKVLGEIIQGKQVNVNTLGETRDILLSPLKAAFGPKGKQGIIQLDSRALGKLDNLGVKTQEAVKLDLEASFKADNLDRISRFFEDPKTLAGFKDLRRNKSGKAASEKLLSGEAKFSQFSARELEAIGVNEFKIGNDKVNDLYKTLSKSGTKSGEEVTKSIDKEIKVLKKAKNKLKNKADKIEKQEEIDRLGTLRTELNTYSNQADLQLQTFNEAVLKARGNYLNQDVGLSLRIPDSIKEDVTKQLAPRAGVGAGTAAAGVGGVGGAAYLGSGEAGTSQYFERPQQRQVAASYLSSPLAAPVLRRKVAKVMAPIKFKPNSPLQPALLKPKDMAVESPMTSMHFSNLLSAPVR